MNDYTTVLIGILAAMSSAIAIQALFYFRKNLKRSARLSALAGEWEALVVEDEGYEKKALIEFRIIGDELRGRGYSNKEAGMYPLLITGRYEPPYVLIEFRAQDPARLGIGQMMLEASPDGNELSGIITTNDQSVGKIHSAKVFLRRTQQGSGGNG
ncbi:MAG: hypothetical protein AAF546_11220 [Verrucomicrobiota bacterium]